jgi:hypothetical protein
MVLSVSNPPGVITTMRIKDAVVYPHKTRNPRPQHLPASQLVRLTDDRKCWVPTPPPVRSVECFKPSVWTIDKEMLAQIGGRGCPEMLSRRAVDEVSRKGVRL